MGLKVLMHEVVSAALRKLPRKVTQHQSDEESDPFQRLNKRFAVGHCESRPDYTRGEKVVRSINQAQANYL
jgi:hypothetical protein